MIELLHTAPTTGAPIRSVAFLDLVAGMGVVGDRNFGKNLWPGQNLTFVEAESVEEFLAVSGSTPDLSLTRRSVVTRGVRLNRLVGATFRIGDVVLRGIDLCEPCMTLGGYLRSTGRSPEEVVSALSGKAGLRCDCIVGGRIRVGQSLEFDLP